MPSFVIEKRGIIKYIIAAIVLIGALLTVTAGYVNAAILRVRTLDITLSKTTIPHGGVRIALATDIHLGVIIGNSRLERLVNKINDIKPDVILLAGDIVDEDLAPVIEQNLGETLRGLRAKYGVYAVTGNHEYIGGVEDAVHYLEKHGIIVLRDNAVLIDGKFYVVGRDDRSKAGFTGEKRKPLNDIISGLDKRLPIILMDHQPFQLDEAVANGIDLQLSGHTHHGQMWPFNHITSAVYEISHGYVQKGDTHVYVSSGSGTWGPPVRVGTRPEIVQIRINHRK
ncbi:MAG TPA: metallophosphoesterase [Spirochaetota bacterium]|nr:metallophosphoesterase [Spirochaetota bacterium]